MYVSSGHGSQRARCVVHSHGVTITTTTATTSPAAIVLLRDFSTLPEAVAQHSTLINIIDNPKMFSTSTRSKSVHGDFGYPKTNSCTRHSHPKPQTPAPRQIVVRVMA